MKLEYYVFAAFIFILMCLVMLIARALFGSVKRRSGLLDEKEASLLKLYRNVEELVNDLYERMQENAAEFQRLEGLRVVRDKHAEVNSVQETQPEQQTFAAEEPTAASEPKKMKPRTRTAKKTESAPSEEPVEAAAPTTAAARRQEILRLLDEGHTDRRIADELDITLSEVRLVKGLYKPVNDSA